MKCNLNETLSELRVNIFREWYTENGNYLTYRTIVKPTRALLERDWYLYGFSFRIKML